MTFKPYGYVLTFDHHKGIDLLFNITSFKNFSIDEEVNIQMKMNKLPTYLPVSLDYRTKEQIEKDIEESNKFRV